MSITNLRKNRFLEKIEKGSVLHVENDLVARCKFNFSYFSIQKNAGCSFHDLTEEQCKKFFTKLQEYSRETLEFWTHQHIGHKDGDVLEIYEKWPCHSEFKIPEHVPAEAIWGRFRLERTFRLVGFVLPNCLNGQMSKRPGFHFDRNTFYLVFLDPKHQFYP